MQLKMLFTHVECVFIDFGLVSIHNFLQNETDTRGRIYYFFYNLLFNMDIIQYYFRTNLKACALKIIV
jgi:hypothetical protein